MALEYNIKVKDDGTAKVKKFGGALKGVDRQSRKTSQGFAKLNSSMKTMFAGYIGIQGVCMLGNYALKSVELSGINEGLKRSFENLGAGIGFTGISMSKLQSATDGTVGSISLMKQANNAMLLGIVKSDDEMADLFDTAQRLAKAVGEDATFGIQSLVTGLGRQSRMMLDNLGIIVDTNKAYETYAAQIGKATAKLTDEERKTAFLNAGMKAAKEKVAALGDEQLDASDKSKQFSANTEALSIAVGTKATPAMNALKGALGSVAKHFSEMLTTKEISELDQLRIQISGVRSGIAETQKTLDAVDGDGLFAKLQKHGLEKQLKRQKDALGDLNLELIDYKQNAFENATLDAAEIVLISIKNAKLEEQKNKLIELQRVKGQKAEDAEQEKKDTKQELHDKNMRRLKEINVARFAGFREAESQGEAELERRRHNMDLNHKTITQIGEEKAARKDAVKTAMSGASALTSQLANNSKEMFALNKGVSIAQATINTYTGATKALDQTGVFGPLMAAGIVAFGLAQVATISSITYQGKRLGGVVDGPGSGTSDSIPTMLSKGEGVVTADDMATAGGYERIKSMIHQGGAQAKTINLTGPVYGTEKFVRDTLLPILQSEGSR